MIIKKEFTVLKGTKNLVSYNESSVTEIDPTVSGRRLYFLVGLAKNKIRHHASDKVISFLKNVNGIRDKELRVVSLNDYILPVTYNVPTKRIFINLDFYGIKDILNLKPIPAYAATFYGIIFKYLVDNPSFVSESYAQPITKYLLSLFVRLFGKQYGLLSTYSNNIIFLKFIINCYVLSSFFGASNCYKKAYSLSGFDYKPYEEKLNKYNFSSIDDFIKALSELKILPGINKYVLSSTVLKFLQLNFLPALEDPARFIAVLSTSEISGNGIVPSFIYKYNEKEFNKIINLSKNIMQRKKI